jgi:LemA protein
MIGLIVLLVLLFVILGLASYGISIYNGLIRVKLNIEKAWANIDVILKQRHDEIPKLIKLCQQYAQYERSTLEKVISLRTQAMQAAGVGERAAAEGQLSAALGKVFAVAEAYPELKANVNIGQLQSRISGLETELADRRELYNESVNIYNIRIQQFPDGIVANMMNLTQKEMFKVSEEERQDVDVNLDLPK